MLVLGNGGHAKSVASVAVRSGVEFVEFISIQGSEQEGFDFSCKSIDLECYSGTVIPGIGHNYFRSRILDSFIKEFPSTTISTLVDPAAVVSQSCHIGAGAVVMPGSILGPDSIIGMGCVVNSGSIVEHDCYLECHVSLAPRSAIAGNVRVGRRSFLGIGSSVIENVRIGRDCMLGGGACLIDNIPDNAVAVGIPAKKIRSRDMAELYFKSAA